MKQYWKKYAICLLAYLVINIIYIEVNHTMPAHIKATLTGGAMLILLTFGTITAYNLSGNWWRVIWIIPLSVVLWATTVDAVLGLWFHGDIFYLSKNTWPDKEILRVVQNGKLYAVTKGIILLVSAPLLYYVKYRGKILSIGLITLLIGCNCPEQKTKTVTVYVDTCKPQVVYVDTCDYKIADSAIRQAEAYQQYIIGWKERTVDSIVNWKNAEYAKLKAFADSIKDSHIEMYDNVIIHDPQGDAEVYFDSISGKPILKIK